MIAPALLDGAMGTALQARGLPAGGLPEEWLRTRPDGIARVHADHVRAGARIVLTCTFNTARLDSPGLAGATEELCSRAVALARASGAERVAGSVGATGLVAGDGRGPPDAEVRERFARPFRALTGAGADLLWSETHVSLREARAALAAARATGRQAVVTMFFVEREGGAVAQDGTPGVDCLEALWRDGAMAVGANCVIPGAALAALVARAVSRVPVPLVVKPSAGTPGARLTPEAFAAGTWRALRAGARLCGGCCGAGPAHLRALAAALRRG